MKNEESKELIKKISSKIKNSKFFCLEGEELYTRKNSKKSRLVITDYNKEKIYYLLAQKKNIIVYHSQDRIDQKIAANKQVVITKNIDTIVKEIKQEQKRKKKSNFIKVFSFTLFIVLLFLFLFFIFTKEIDAKPMDQKVENYVFLGDSITEFYQLDSYYGNLPTVNSGVSGNTAYSIISDLKKRVYDYNPTKVFLLVGTNDLSHRTDKEIVNDIVTITNKIYQNRPNALIYVESIYPVNATTDNDVVIDWMVGERDNKRIRNINKMLKQKSTKNHYQYLDMYSVLMDENKNLDLSYTTDGLHLSEKGYKVVTKEIKKILEEKPKK